MIANIKQNNSKVILTGVNIFSYFNLKFELYDVVIKNN